MYIIYGVHDRLRACQLLNLNLIKFFQFSYDYVL